MKNCCKKSTSHISPLQLALIITGAVVAAAGIIVLILALIKKSKKKAALRAEDELDSIDVWDLDEDILSELELDEDEGCCCEECTECTECPTEETSAEDAE